MVTIDGTPLSLGEIEAAALDGAGVGLSKKSVSRMAASRAVIDAIVEQDRTVYGVNTGFGKLSSVRVPSDQLQELQVNLVRSHSCGVGRPLSEHEVRAMLLLRANVLAVGLSGARPVVAETLLAMLNEGVHPVVPEQGSVGASGDLAPLAHLALAAIGEGECFYHGSRIASGSALSDSGIEPLRALTQLQALNLEGTQVSDLEPLSELTQLQELNLNYTQVSDLEPLRELTQLRELELRGTPVSDLSPLVKMKGVWLYLDKEQQLTVPEKLKKRVSLH